MNVGNLNYLAIPAGLWAFAFFIMKGENARVERAMFYGAAFGLVIAILVPAIIGLEPKPTVGT